LYGYSQKILPKQRLQDAIALLSALGRGEGELTVLEERL